MCPKNITEREREPGPLNTLPEVEARAFFQSAMEILPWNVKGLGDPNKSLKLKALFLIRVLRLYFFRKQNCSL